MDYDYYRRVLCPLCEVGQMRAVNAALARCSGCEETMSQGFYEALLRIRGLPEAEGEARMPSEGNPYKRGSGRD
jgi:ribosomal protein L37AE/L43A